MLGKLMKYEFKATGRIFLPLFAALLFLAVVNRFLYTLRASAPSIIGTIVSVILIIGIAVLTFVLTLQRFQKNLMSNEGYLMMTLPTRTDSLILSKMLVSTIWIVASVILVTISIMIMAMSNFNIMDLVDFISMVMDEFSIKSSQLAIYIVEFIVGVAFSVFSSVLMLYACMALSMLVNKFRWLFAFGAYMAISTVMQILFVVFAIISDMLNVGSLFQRFIDDMSIFGISQVVILMMILAEVALCVIFYFVTRYMLKKRLNLQ